MSEPVTKERLLKYIYLKTEYYNQIDRLARLENDKQLPAMRESDGSQRSILKTSRMENAIARYEEQSERINKQLAEISEEMSEIETAVDSLDDPIQKEVLRLRYMDPEECKHMKWGDVARTIYGSDDEKNLIAIWRIHGHALQALKDIANEN